MKINWGTGIVIAFVLFISFILYFVIRITVQPKFAYDLVDEEYYKTELKYQDEIDKLENTKTLSDKIIITKSETGFLIKFPQEINNTTTGTISFFRPSTKVLDFEIPIAITNNQMIIEHEHLVSGFWNITIDFTTNSQEYLVKRSITY